MSEQYQKILLKARETVRKTLAQIKLLDQEVSIKNYESATLKLDLFHNGQYLNNDSRRKLVQKIDKVDDEIEELSENKVRLANYLYSNITSSCEEVNLIFNERWKTQKIEISKETDANEIQLRSLIAECKIEENQQFCCCSSQKKIELCNETMILCEREDCPHRWYHTSCVGIQGDQELPEQWICNMCKLGFVLSESSECSDIHV